MAQHVITILAQHVIAETFSRKWAAIVTLWLAGALVIALWLGWVPFRYFTLAPEQREALLAAKVCILARLCGYDQRQMRMPARASHALSGLESTSLPILKLSQTQGVASDPKRLRLALVVMMEDEESKNVVYAPTLTLYTSTRTRSLQARKITLLLEPNHTDTDTAARARPGEAAVRAGGDEKGRGVHNRHICAPTLGTHPHAHCLLAPKPAHPPTQIQHSRRHIGSHPTRGGRGSLWR